MIDEKKLIEELNNTSLDVKLRTSMTPPQIVNATIEQYLKHVIETINRQPQAERTEEGDCYYSTRECEQCKVNPMYPKQKCCFNCAENMFTCEVGHSCGEDCLSWKDCGSYNGGEKE